MPVLQQQIAGQGIGHARRRSHTDCGLARSAVLRDGLEPGPSPGVVPEPPESSRGNRSVPAALVKMVADIMPACTRPRLESLLLEPLLTRTWSLTFWTRRMQEFASTISAIREPRTTTGGVNFVIGFRPELWREVVPEDAPPGVEGFNKEIKGRRICDARPRNMMRWYGCPAALMT